MWLAKFQVTESALTEPITAMSSANMSTPPMSTIRVDRSMTHIYRLRGPPILIRSALLAVQ
jgi:hypothetical protein